MLTICTNGHNRYFNTIQIFCREMNTFLEIEGLVLNTFSFLGINDIVNISLVCKRWNRIANVEGNERYYD